jgi:thiol-disulfide isomerase/thioredoxin
VTANTTGTLVMLREPVLRTAADALLLGDGQDPMRHAASRPTGRGLLASVLLVGALALTGSSSALAYHEANEPSDGTVCSFKPVAPPVPMPADLGVVDGSGNRLLLSAFRGKTVLLNLWATWCPPCVRELPALDRLAARRADEDLAVIPVSLDAGGTAAARPFFTRLDIRHLPLLAAPVKDLGRFLPVDVLPASFVIDRQGRVTHFLRSYVDWDDPAVDAFFDAALVGEDPTAAGCGDR